MRIKLFYRSRARALTFVVVRQLLFAPLWDSGASRSLAGCFVSNTSTERIFSPETELNFLTAFNNSVMAEGLDTSTPLQILSSLIQLHQLQDLHLLLRTARKEISLDRYHMSFGRRCTASLPAQSSSLKQSRMHFRVV